MDPLLVLVNMKAPSKLHLNLVHGWSLYIALKCGVYGKFFGSFIYIVLYIYKNYNFWCMHEVLCPNINLGLGTQYRILP